MHLCYLPVHCMYRVDAHELEAKEVQNEKKQVIQRYIGDMQLFPSQ